MQVFARAGQFYHEAKENSWFHLFTVFCRVALALGFIPSGIVKIMGERFTGLPANHPLGHYFDALFRTGYYYTFIGVVQLLTALLLLIPRTALLGAVMYFPTILNICILAYATRFEGTRITTLMLLANIYLLCWDYDRIKYVLPFERHSKQIFFLRNKALSNKFPYAFFAGVMVVALLVIVINIFIFDIRPGNSMIECRNGSLDSRYPKASLGFCDCIYTRGKPLDQCLEEYRRAKENEKSDAANGSYWPTLIDSFKYKNLTRFTIDTALLEGYYQRQDVYHAFLTPKSKLLDSILQTRQYYLYSWQETGTPLTAFTVVLEGLGEALEMHYLIFDPSGKLLSDVVVANHGGEPGEYDYASESFFVSKDTLVTIKTRKLLTDRRTLKPIPIIHPVNDSVIIKQVFMQGACRVLSADSILHTK